MRCLLIEVFSRNEIATCEEAAYDSLPLKDAATLLFFKSRSDLVKFAESVVSDFYIFFCHID
jgi:predicted Kef-type K+ transport protein